MEQPFSPRAIVHLCFLAFWQVELSTSALGARCLVAPVILGDEADMFALLIQVALAGNQIRISPNSAGILSGDLGVHSLDHQPALQKDCKVSCFATALQQHGWPVRPHFACMTRQSH